MSDLGKLYKFLRKNSFYSEARYLKKISMLPEDSGYNSLGYFLRNMRTIRDRQPRQFGELESKWTSEDNIGKIFEAVDNDELFRNRREYPFSSSAYEKLLRYYLDNGGDINFLFSIEDEKNKKEERGARTGNWPLYSAADEIIESERAKNADTERYFGLGRYDNEYWNFHPKHIEEKLLGLDPYNDKDDLSSALSIAKKFSGMEGKASASIMSIFNKNFPNILNRYNKAKESKSSNITFDEVSDLDPESYFGGSYDIAFPQLLDEMLRNAPTHIFYAYNLDKIYGKEYPELLEYHEKNKKPLNYRPYDPDETLEIVGPSREHLNYRPYDPDKTLEIVGPSREHLK